MRIDNNTLLLPICIHVSVEEAFENVAFDGEWMRGGRTSCFDFLKRLSDYLES
jgi:hypothetical protein